MSRLEQEVIKFVSQRAESTSTAGVVFFVYDAEQLPSRIVWWLGIPAIFDALAAGILPPNVVRWYWWRLNGWGYEAYEFRS